MTHNIILASQSPRRKELLKALGWTFEISIPDIDEDTSIDTMRLQEIPEFLATQKAEKVIQQLTDSRCVVIAADTLVILNDEILSKPKDKNESMSILKKLSGQTHEVITGVCLMNRDKKISFSSTTEVTFKTLNDSELHHYINHFNTLDKAGAYGIQDWIGLVGVEKIHGDFYNVMGLPVHLVYEKMQEF